MAKYFGPSSKRGTEYCHPTFNVLKLGGDIWTDRRNTRLFSYTTTLYVKEFKICIRHVVLLSMYIILFRDWRNFRLQFKLTNSEINA